MAEWIKKTDADYPTLVLEGNEDIRIEFREYQGFFSLYRGPTAAPQNIQRLADAKTEGERYARDRAEFQ